MLNAKHLRDYVIVPALEYAGDGNAAFASPAAIELLLGTAAQESRLQWLHQLGTGPALGLFQIEPATHADIYRNWLAHKPDWLARVLRIRADDRALNADAQLMSNLAYAAVIARLVYFRTSVPMARAGDIAGHAAVWKRVYNTHLGKGTPDQFVKSWNTIIKPNL